MKISTAKKILGINQDLPPKELSALYSNLASNAKDIKEIIVVSTAYILVQQDSSWLHSDLGNVFRVKEELKSYFDQAKGEYFDHVGDVKSNLKSTIERMIDNTDQTNELRAVVERDVADTIQYSTANLSLYLRSLDEKLTRDERYSLARVFYPLYKERQAKWLRRFYASRIFHIEILFLILTTTITHIFSILNFIPGLTQYITKNFPELMPVLSILSSQVSQYFVDILAGSLGIVFMAMLIRYWHLGPGNQLITPRLSTQGIRELIGETAGKITLSDLDWAKRGGIGALAGLAFDPTFVLSAIAAVFGIVTWIFSDSFREKKRKAKVRIWEKLDLGFNELDYSVGQWFTISERVAYHAMIKSVRENCIRLSGHLKPKQFYRKAA